MKKLIYILIMGALVFTFISCAKAPDEISIGPVESYGHFAVDDSREYTIEEMMTYALQDEYLARSEYELIMDELGVSRPFSNIIKSEEQHIDMLLDLFESYGYSAAEDLSSDYVVVPEGLNEAFETGVQAEIDNIAMYDRFLDEDLPDDVRSTFEFLSNASENHLNAFRRGLSRY